MSVLKTVGQLVSKTIPACFGLWKLKKSYSDCTEKITRASEKQFNAVMKDLEPCIVGAGIRRDIKVLSNICTETPGAFGNNICGEAFIEVPAHMEEVDPEALKYVMKHELAHIRHNDFLKKNLLPAALAFLTVALPLSTAGFAFLFTSSMLAESVYSHFAEHQADAFAITHASDKELLGGRRALIAMALLAKEQQNARVGGIRWLFNKEGECLLDCHPSYSSRISAIEKEIAKRDVKVDNAVEGSKIEELYKYTQWLEKEIEKLGLD